ncbi:MAG: Spy/CpxP family protein refolding chaperone [Planctomycetia bacterium]|nr:Spy/CpxP family protein refolding chaperone [Planctomycetia bacterium]
MKACQFVALSAALTFVLALEPASAADDAPQQQKKGQFQKGQKGEKGQFQKGQFQKGQFQAQNFQRPGGGGSLLSTAALEKLNLSAEQKEKYTKLDEEYKDKAKANGEKIREAFQSKDKDKIAEAMQSLRTEGQKLREDYLAKVEGFLNSDQKKTFEEVKAQRPGGFGGIGGGRGGAPGQVLSPGLQERLKLSDEQKKKVEDLQKDLDNKINGILNDEQRKQLDEIKKGGGQPPRRPNPST